MTEATQDREIIAIQGVVAAAEKLQSDAEGFTQLLTEEVSLVNFAGRRVVGRENLHRAMTEALKTEFARVYTRNELVDVRFLRSDVALVDCIKHISDEREPAAKDPDAPLVERGSLTFVLLKEDGSWRIALAQTTPIAT
jgi:uncharacterized protein (TIGR02246 family)